MELVMFWPVRPNGKIEGCAAFCASLSNAMVGGFMLL